MNRLELNRRAYLLKIIVEQLIFIYLMIEAVNYHLILWLIVLSGAVFFINIRQSKLTDDAKWWRFGLIFLEWLVLLTLFPFAKHSLYSILMIVMIITVISSVEHVKDIIFFSFIFSATYIFHSVYFGEFTFQELFSFMLLLVFFASYAYFYRKFEYQQWEMERLNEALQEYAEKEKEWALEQERNKIARDIHDTVAHQSTGLIVQLQKLKRAYELGRDNEVRDSIRESEQVARLMLNDMRQSVRLISPLEKSSSPFEQLFTDFMNITDVLISYEGIEYLYDLLLAHQADLYSICQEALTNAKRHGQATKVDIAIDKTREYLVISIKDNGVGIKDNFEKGFGLTKMYERVKAAKGDWNLISENGVTIVIKWPVSKGGSND